MNQLETFKTIHYDYSRIKASYFAKITMMVFKRWNKIRAIYKKKFVEEGM